MDPVIASKMRDKAEREAVERLTAWRALWPVLLVPSAADRALGYTWISADDSQIYDKPRAVTPRKALDEARQAGWWAAACQTLAMDRATLTGARKDDIELRAGVGVHAFWPSRRAEPGTIAVAAWWINNEFAWAARADYRDKDGRIIFDRTTIGARDLIKLLREH